jgi:small GTP-binding protein
MQASTSHSPRPAAAAVRRSASSSSIAVTPRTAAVAAAAAAEQQKKRTITVRNGVDYRTKVLNIVLIGDARIGKTTMTRSFFEVAGGPFKEDTKSTVCPDHRNRIIRVPMAEQESKQLFMSKSEKTPPPPPTMFTPTYVWDTAGQEQFQDNMEFFYRRADVVIVCVDSKDQSTLDHAVDKWIPRVKTQRPECSIVIAITMWDQFSVPEEYEKSAKKFATKHGPNTEMKKLTIQDVFQRVSAIVRELEIEDVFEVSGRYGYNVNSVFLRAVQLFIAAIDENEMKNKEYKQFAIRYVDQNVKQQKSASWDDFFTISQSLEKMTMQGDLLPPKSRSPSIFEQSPSPSPNSSPATSRRSSMSRLAIRRNSTDANTLAAAAAAAAEAAAYSSSSSPSSSAPASSSSSPSLTSPLPVIPELTQENFRPRVDPLLVPTILNLQNDDGTPLHPVKSNAGGVDLTGAAASPVFPDAKKGIHAKTTGCSC